MSGSDRTVRGRTAIQRTPRHADELPRPDADEVADRIGGSELKFKTALEPGAFVTRTRGTAPVCRLVSNRHIPTAMTPFTDGTRLSVTIVIPDPVGTIAMKTLVRSARNDARDVHDL